MINKIVTNGCSYTWGYGLNPETSVVDAYPYKLSQLLDAELFDLSQPGVSCHYIVRTTIDFFLDRLDEDLSDYIVILQLPPGHRFEYWCTEEKTWKPRILGHDNLDKNLVNYFGSKEWDFYIQTGSILQVGNFLKENNIKYYISNNGTCWEDLVSETGSYKIKKRMKYIEDNYNILFGSFKNSGFTSGFSERLTISEEDPHWSERGHTSIANNIYEFINNG